MSERALVQHALRALPDLPRWVEARALLLSGRCALFGAPPDFVIRNEAPGGQLAVVVGRPRSELLRAAVEGPPGRELLCAPQDAPHVARHLPRWSREIARLYQLHDPASLCPADPRVRPLLDGDSLAHLPRELREELDSLRREREVWCAFDGELPASFAYSWWRTEGQFDISIDTPPRFRRRGLARLAVSQLIRHERAADLEPVWGALESNHPSQRLAESLGFRQVDEIALFASPRENA